ncbi:lanthionine synthetase LanC family protein, partial [Micromonospora sp. NPDC047074]|uniref:lanthionine synthetase LanC family protein n=1 Tax=Micromonospora sp. NPDC047074 TaxID=3154339 RepID=UPI0033CAC0BB
RRAGPPTAGAAGYGWCRGAAGLALAHSALAHSALGHNALPHNALAPDAPAPRRHAPDDGPAPAYRADEVIRLLTDRPLLGDLSLCHGELGIAEALHGIAPGTDPVRRHLGRILDAVDRYGPSCGTPNGVPTPGLLTGLAGIGYELLRLAGAAPVPSVLLLEPTPAPPPPD